MCDPWYMFILIHYFGPKYIIWDKSAHINFVSPGKGTVTATFEVSEQRFREIQENIQDGQKYCPVFETQVVDAENKTVAHLSKELYIRKNDESVDTFCSKIDLHEIKRKNRDGRTTVVGVTSFKIFFRS